MTYIISHFGLKLRRACRLIKQTRSTQYYASRKDPRDDLRTRMRELAQTRVRYGYRCLHVLLKRDGWRLGKNQMCRLYCEEQLQLRSKLPKLRNMLVIRRDARKLALSTRSGAWTLYPTSCRTACAFER